MHLVLLGIKHRRRPLHLIVRISLTHLVRRVLLIRREIVGRIRRPPPLLLVSITARFLVMRTASNRQDIIQNLVDMRHMSVLHTPILQRTEDVGACGSHRRINRAGRYVLGLNVARQSALIHGFR